MTKKKANTNDARRIEKGGGERRMTEKEKWGLVVWVESRDDSIESLIIAPRFYSLSSTVIEW